MDKAFEDQSKRLEKALNRLVEDLDKSHLRKMHANMHMCAAKCCQSKDDSIEKVYNCVEVCRTPVDEAWGLVEEELHIFHEKLSNCLENCSTKTKWVSNLTEAQLTRSTKEMVDCTGGCVDNMINTIPKLLERIKQNISRSNLKRPVMATASNEEEDCGCHKEMK